MLGTLSDAITALTGTISGLLTPPADPSMTPDVIITASKAQLSGIGGFVGLNEVPRAELHARLLNAVIVLRVRAPNAADLLAAEATVTRDLLGADPIALRLAGVRQLSRITDGLDRQLTAADGLDTPAGSDLRFSVCYEFRPLPLVAEGMIGSVQQDATTATLDGPSRLLYSSEFLVDPMANFTTVSAAGSGTVGAWSWNSSSQEILQTGTRAGGTNGLTGNKTGTYLLLNDTATGGPVSDFVLHADVRSDGPGGIGLVFRYQDTSNFGFMLMEQPPGIRLFGRRTGNVGSLLAEGGQSSTVGFTTNQFMRLRLLAQADRFELAINGITALSGRDSGLPASGMVGFFCRRNATARFRRLSLRSL